MRKIIIFFLSLLLLGCVEQPFGGSTPLDRSNEFGEMGSDRWGEGSFGIGEAVPTQPYAEATPWPDPTGTPLPVASPQEVPTAVPVQAPPVDAQPADPAAGLKDWEEIDAKPPEGLAPPGEGAWCYSHYSAGLGLPKVWFQVGEPPASHHLYQCVGGPDGQPMWQRR